MFLNVSYEMNTIIARERSSTIACAERSVIRRQRKSGLIFSRRLSSWFGLSRGAVEGVDCVFIILLFNMMKGGGDSGDACFPVARESGVAVMISDAKSELPFI